MFFNKYIDGYPYLCRALDISSGGMLTSSVNEPKHDLESFPVEFRLPGAPESIWAWAKSVGRRGEREGIQFVKLNPDDRRRLERCLEVTL